MLRKSPLFFLTIFAISFFLRLPDAFAIFTMSVQSSSGSSDLSFGRIGPEDFKKNLELTIRVTSDIAKQYTVSQRLIQPLQTMEGSSLDEDQFRMYPLVGSNFQGTLLFRDEQPVARYDTTLYSSTPGGDSDQFKVVYTITPSPGQSPGTYYGRLSYVLIPLNSSEDQVVVSVSVYVELAPGRAPFVEVKTSSGKEELFFSTKDMDPSGNLPPSRWPGLLIKVPRPLGGAYRILQEVENYALMSAQGYPLDLSKVDFIAQDAQTQRTLTEGNLDSVAKTAIYTSQTIGGPAEVSVAYYPSADLGLQRPGTYRGRLNLWLEVQGRSATEMEPIGSFDFEVEVAEVFELSVLSEGRQGLFLDFNKPGRDGRRQSQVEIKVRSNLGRPYQVLQKASSSLVNENGEKIPEKDFTVRVKEVRSSEPARFSLKDPGAVKEGDTILFRSGPTGEESVILITYDLLLDGNTQPGVYGNKMAYTLTVD